MHTVKVKELKAKERIASFEEVVLGYNQSQALAEAKRCIRCKKPLCIKGCPVGIDIKKFIHQITQKDYRGAFFTIKEKNNFPSICGRVCPAEYQCRATCVLNKNRGKLSFASCEAINIHFLERFVGDYGIENNLSPFQIESKKLSTKTVAVVGSGPAGLSAAGELARLGIKVKVFEALHKTGGVLRYGIPPFRLPPDVLDFEIDYLKKIGVDFVPNFIVGKSKTLDQLLKEGFSALFLGLGAGVPSFLGIEGENLCNVYSANEFLTRVNLMGAYNFPQNHTPVNIGKDIVVIGGGNTAMDAARVALRLQKINNIPENTSIIYRRTEGELPARRLEIEHAKEEGVDFKFLVQPVKFHGNDDAFISQVESMKCFLGEPDSSGRRRPIPKKESNFFLDCQVAIVAVGLNPNTLLTSATPQLEVDNYSNLVVNPQTMQTSKKGVYAGGDIVGGEGTVIEAMGMAKKAARAITNYLLTEEK